MSYLPQTEDIRLSTNDTKTTESEGSDAQAGVNVVSEENIQEGDLLSIASTGMEGDSSANLMNGSANTFSVPTTRSEIGKSISDRRVIPFPQKSYFHDSFVSLQKWEGVVLSLGEDTFTAKLVDSTDTSRPAEITELALEDVQEYELEMVKPGAIFILTIGYHISKSRQKRRQTHLLFRRLPVWQERDLQKALEKANRFIEKMHVDGE